MMEISLLSRRNQCPSDRTGSSSMMLIALPRQTNSVPSSPQSQTAGSSRSRKAPCNGERAGGSQAAAQARASSAPYQSAAKLANVAGIGQPSAAATQASARKGGTAPERIS